MNKGSEVKVKSRIAPCNQSGKGCQCGWLNSQQEDCVAQRLMQFLSERCVSICLRRSSSLRVIDRASTEDLTWYSWVELAVVSGVACDGVSSVDVFKSLAAALALELEVDAAA